jgi:adenosine/AMP kinase
VPSALVRDRPGHDQTGEKNAAAIGAGHGFIVFLGDGFYPLNVLNTLKMVPVERTAAELAMLRHDLRQFSRMPDCPFVLKRP